MNSISERSTKEERPLRGRWRERKMIDIHIGEMLARNARMYPDKIALVERIPTEKKRFTITWREFDERANKFSQVLRVKGRKVFFGEVPRNPTGKIEKPKLRKRYTGMAEAFKI
jgi:acyl-CoA synthetase (AMP-forming)/AMP-acid ligase II